MKLLHRPLGVPPRRGQPFEAVDFFAVDSGFGGGGGFGGFSGFRGFGGFGTLSNTPSL